MAVRKLTLVRTRAGRKPQNVDLDILREMIDEWTNDPTSGLSNGEVYADRQTAQKVAQAYKGYLAKHHKVEVAAVTATNDPAETGIDGAGYIFSLNPETVEPPAETPAEGEANAA